MGAGGKVARFLYHWRAMGGDRRRWLRLAVEVSLLLHLLLLALPERLLSPRAVAARPAVLPPPEEEKPVRFELVELPDQKEEPPSLPDTPASDLSRRAHGGEGESALQPGSRGTSPELRLVPPNPAPAPGQGAAPRELPAPQPPQPPSAPPAGTSPGESSGVKVPPPQEEQPPAPQPKPALKGLSPFTAPQLGVLPDRKGGQVDLGPLSFDTQWYDWGPYAAEMLRRIRYHWRIPEIAQLGVPGVVRIRFYIEKNGRVSDLVILKESSHPPMDFAARDAILNASPLPPLPPEVGVEREGVVITFYYNTRPPEDS